MIDFDTDWPEGHEPLRYSVDDLDRWMAGAGFVRAESHEFLEHNFFVIYRLAAAGL